MNQAERAGRELRAMDDLAAQDSFLHRLSPLSKLFVTIFYLAVVVSFPRYRLTALVWMALFPVAGYQLAGIALRTWLSEAAARAAAGLRGGAAQSDF